MKSLLALSLMFLMFALAGLAPAAGARVEEKLDGAEIVRRHVEAVGGRAALARIKTRVAVGALKKENEPEAKLLIASEAPNRVSAIYRFERYDWQLTFDGSAAIFRPVLARQSDLAALEAKYREVLSSGLMFQGISLYNALAAEGAGGLRFVSKGTKKLKGRAAHVVEIKGGRPALDGVRLFFDAETFMWVRTEFGRVEVTRPMGPFTNEAVSQADSEQVVSFYFEASDFREVDGLKLPHRFEHTATAPILRQRVAGSVSGRVDQYQHNVAVDPLMFR